MYYGNEISNNQSSYILITMRQHCHTSVYITNEEIGHVVLHNLLLLLKLLVQYHQMSMHRIYSTLYIR